VRDALALQLEQRVRADEHDRAGSANHEAVLGRRVGDVGRDGERPPAVPRRRLHPVEAVEQRGGAAVASIVLVGALNVGDAVLLEQGHQVGLDRL